MKSLYVMMLDILVIESKFFGVDVNQSVERPLTEYEISYKHCTGIDQEVVVKVENSKVKRITVNNTKEQQVLENELLTDLIQDLFIRDNFYNIISGVKGNMTIDDHFRIDQVSQQVLHG